jgi:protein-S-isoprenylcysteine O-methyltransferase Ste14
LAIAASSEEQQGAMSRIFIVAWTVIRVAVVVLCVGWLLLHLRVLDRVIGFSLPAWPRPLGLALLLAGGCMVLYCATLLRTPGIVPTEFVALGPFRYVRNPMSLGAVTMMLGLALFCRSISLLIFSAIFFTVMHGFVVLVEEPGLEKRFGHPYLQYKQSVNRWIPERPSEDLDRG